MNILAHRLRFLTGRSIGEKCGRSTTLKSIWRAAIYHESDTAGRFEHAEEAKPVLEQLKKHYNLILITSRSSVLKEITEAWVRLHYAGIFDDIKFAGIYDGPLHEGMFHMTKADLFASNKVDFVIDDQLKHCHSGRQTRH